jgi:hypothetical protein
MPKAGQTPTFGLKTEQFAAIWTSRLVRAHAAGFRLRRAD